MFSGSGESIVVDDDVIEGLENKLDKLKQLHRLFEFGFGTNGEPSLISIQFVLSTVYLFKEGCLSILKLFIN